MTTIAVPGPPEHLTDATPGAGVDSGCDVCVGVGLCAGETWAAGTAFGPHAINPITRMPAKRVMPMSYSQTLRTSESLCQSSRILVRFRACDCSTSNQVAGGQGLAC